METVIIFLFYFFETLIQTGKKKQTERQKENSKNKTISIVIDKRRGAQGNISPRQGNVYFYYFCYLYHTEFFSNYSYNLITFPVHIISANTENIYLKKCSCIITVYTIIINNDLNYVFPDIVSKSLSLVMNTRLPNLVDFLAKRCINLDRVRMCKDLLASRKASIKFTSTIT